MENQVYTFGEIVDILGEGQYAVNGDGIVIKRNEHGTIVQVKDGVSESFEGILVLTSDILNSEWMIQEDEDDSLEQIDEKAKELYYLIKEYVYKDGGSRERAREVMEIMIKYQTFGV